MDEFFSKKIPNNFIITYYKNYKIPNIEQSLYLNQKFYNSLSINTTKKISHLINNPTISYKFYKEFYEKNNYLVWCLVCKGKISHLLLQNSNEILENFEKNNISL